MNTVTFIEVKPPFGEMETHAIIEHADGSFTSMPKVYYEELEAAKKVMANEAKTK